MPQIAQLADTYSSQVFWLLVFFGITFFVVGRGMVPKVMDTVQLRNGQIADDLKAAQAARDRADEEEEAWRLRENANREAAQGVIAEAKAQAAADSERRQATAQKRIDKRLEEAEIEIGEARTSALTEIEAVAVEATQDIVARLAGTRVAEAEARDAVRGALVHG